MEFQISSCRIILCAFLVFLFSACNSAMKIQDFQEEADQDFQESSKIKNGNMVDIDPPFHVFFTIKDLKIGKKFPIYFPNKDPSTSPHLLSRDETDSIPFSLQHLPYLLEFFSFPRDSPQAKGMEYTLSLCEVEPIAGESKLCATSLESMLDYVRVSFGLSTQLKALSTNYMVKPIVELQNYIIMEEPKEFWNSKMMTCHVMPYPYVVYYCHGIDRADKVYEVLLGGENGEKVKAVGICHVDTSYWDPDHVSFRLLKIRPGSIPVCHFLPPNHLVWVPFSSDSN